MKPFGLWVSVDGGDDWVSWCTNDYTRWFGDGKHQYRIKLVKDTNVLLIDNATDLRAFTDKYIDDTRTSHRTHIRWDAVSQFYGGIIIAPYLYECRLDVHTFWYYSWDCASGCIWDHRCIREVIYRGVKRLNTEDVT
jgi:hypothetical protein